MQHALGSATQSQPLWFRRMVSFLFLPSQIFSAISFSFAFVHPSISCLCFPCRIEITTLATIQRKELPTSKKPTTPTATFASTVRPCFSFFWPENFPSNSLGYSQRQKEIKQSSVPILPKLPPQKHKKKNRSLFAAVITAGRKNKETPIPRLEKGIKNPHPLTPSCGPSTRQSYSVPCNHCASHQA
ncbi:MAG: hypothetical protein J3R72DRAFT_459617 [Linnemannia gamsii]|nr:MAG: hypothetical protein J3R72DRAFT_459617 [Linnemannia gamsii]